MIGLCLNSTGSIRCGFVAGLLHSLLYDLSATNPPKKSNQCSSTLEHTHHQTDCITCPLKAMTTALVYESSEFRDQQADISQAFRQVGMSASSP